jgi:SAM-dependent methyltransferase
MAPPDRPVFEPEYHVLARHFDLLNEKYVPYGRQCDFLEEAFLKYSRKPLDILDLASGTGLHAIPLARRGYHVVGVELSNEMLEEARQKAGSSGSGNPADLQTAEYHGKLTFLHADMRQLRFKEEFDVAFAFNYPVAYCLTHTELAALLAGVSRALRSGGLFLFDYFSHFDLLSTTQQEEAESEEVRFEIAKEFSFDHLRQVLLEHDIYTIHNQKDGSTRILEGYDEFRVYYPQELVYYLETMPALSSAAGFRVLGFHKRWNLEAEPNRSDLVVVAEKL